jgi:hypothetical protein
MTRTLESMTATSRLSGRHVAPIMRGMVSRRNLNALAELGNRRRELAAELAEVDARIDKNLTKTYLEGWTWEELREASSLSQGPLANRLRKLGLIKPGAERKKPAAIERRGQQRVERLNETKD